MKKCFIALMILFFVICLSVPSKAGAEPEVQVTKTILNDTFENWNLDGGYGWETSKLRSHKITSSYVIDDETTEVGSNIVLVAQGMGEIAGGTSLSSFNYSRNYQISMNVMFRPETNGIAKFFLQGLFTTNPGDWSVLEFTKGIPNETGVIENKLELRVGGAIVASNLVAQSGYVDSLKDDDASLGNIGFDKWIKITFRKNGPNIEGLVNDVKCFSKEFSNMSAPVTTNINTYSVDEKGLIYVDNVLVEDILPTIEENVAVVSVTISMPRMKIKTGETISIKAVKNPYDATASNYEWYINEELQSNTEGTLSFTGEAEGSYEFYCKLDGKESAKRTLVVEKAVAQTPSGDTNPSTDVNPTTLLIICICCGVVTLASVSMVAIVLLGNKKKSK